MKRPNFKIVKLVVRKLRSYFIVFFSFIFILTIATFWIVSKIKETQAEVVKLQALSLVDLDAVDHETVLLLSKEASKLSFFLPDEFDLYQVIALINQIAQKTKFTIQSYNLQYEPVVPNTMQQQSLNLTGSGTIEQFMAFIEEYKFITGKLLTIDSINLSGSRRVLSNLLVNIYAFKPDISLQNEPIRPLDETDKLILKKINQYYTFRKELKEEEDYQNKENPFQ